MLYLNLIIISYTQLCSEQTAHCVDADTGLTHSIYSPNLLIMLTTLQPDDIELFNAVFFSDVHLQTLVFLSLAQVPALKTRTRLSQLYLHQNAVIVTLSPTLTPK